MSCCYSTVIVYGTTEIHLVELAIWQDRRLASLSQATICLFPLFLRSVALVFTRQL